MNLWKEKWKLRKGNLRLYVGLHFEKVPQQVGS